MTAFEIILVALLIPVYGIVFYIAGRMNLLNLLLKISEEKIKEISKESSENDGEDDRD